jgi:flagellar M-ring protein FliF
MYEVRFSLAGKGIPNSGITGYEIFDESSMGMSEFMQKLNFKRALEGELARTIVQQDGIEGARVLIVLPKKTVFKDEEEPPKASVVIKLSGGNSFTSANTTAIINLVANSVEGLTPQNVTLIDTKGRLLSKKVDNEQESFVNTKQYEIKKTVEQYLANKVQSILDQVIGYANSTVQVNADFNFSQVEKTMQTFDPESQVAISEQSVKNDNFGTTVSDSTVESSQTNTVNYEINKTVQKVIEETGNITKLSVAVVVNDVQREVKKGDATETIFEPRSIDQMRKLETIVRNAVGIDL